MGSGTDIGKTYVLTSICKELVRKKKKVMALKPIISGWMNNHNNDVVRILYSLSLPITQKNIDLISFKRLNPPLAPNMAAKKEGIRINFDDIVNFCARHVNKYNYLFIEGAGGVMCPITDSTTYTDLIKKLEIPVIFIAPIYLGTISHILTALEALRNCRIKAVILNPYNSKDNLDENELKECIQNFTKAPVIIYNQEKVLVEIL
ncbi:MAG: dethiobiotin synthase [Rickettsiaceae bacterium H1]|nr:dethiobiotin synthase [Rickettsiaceae bacterium H1]